MHTPLALALFSASMLVARSKVHPTTFPDDRIPGSATAIVIIPQAPRIKCCFRSNFDPYRWLPPENASFTSTVFALSPPTGETAAFVRCSVAEIVDFCVSVVSLLAFVPSAARILIPIAPPITPALLSSIAMINIPSYCDQSLKCLSAFTMTSCCCATSFPATCAPAINGAINTPSTVISTMRS